MNCTRASSYSSISRRRLSRAREATSRVSVCVAAEEYPGEGDPRPAARQVRRDFSDDLPPVICTHAPRYPQARGRTRGGEARGNVCRLVGAVLFAASDENGGHPDPLPPRLVYSYLTFPFLSFP